MKRITCKICRRMGEKICAHAKCAAERKPYPPGIHGKGKLKRKREVSEFGRQLFAKQKVRFLYGLSERQFARLVTKALRHSGGNPGATLFRFLETRLDTTLFRLGFAATPQMARMLINHGHVRVNGKKVTRSSFMARPGQTITLLPSAPSMLSDPLRRIEASEEKIKGHSFMPSWLSRGEDKRSGKIEAWPDAAKEERLHFPDTRSIMDYYAR